MIDLRASRRLIGIIPASLVLFACGLGGHGAWGEEHALDLGSFPRRADYRTAQSDPAYRRFREHSKATIDPRAVVEEGREEPLRVVLLGDTFIERESDEGFLEAELTRLWPDRDLVFRNLGWSGDNLQGDARVEFGPGEQRRSGWERPQDDVGNYGFEKMVGQVIGARPDVLLIGYGSNVASDDSEGLARFKTGLGRLLDTLEPFGAHVILLSPPRRESIGPGLPDVDEPNRRLAAVAAHLQEVATSRDLSYVDVLGRLVSDASAPQGALLTDNGIHLNHEGYRSLASIVVEDLADPEELWSVSLRAGGALDQASTTEVRAIATTEHGLRFTVRDDRLPGVANHPRKMVVKDLEPGYYGLDIDGQRVARATANEWAAGVEIHGGPDFQQYEELREKIKEKNRLLFYGFRPQNKAYIFLFRRHERGHHEAEISQFATLARRKESEIARLRRPQVRSYELMREKDYPEHEVPFDAPAPDVRAELEQFEVAEGFEVSVFASDPMIANPININWDARGRMWVATSTTYPHLQPGEAPDDKIVILEDIDRDGHADVSKIFAQGLLVPHSVLPVQGGAYVTQSTDLLFLEDADGDDRAEKRRVLFTGFGNADVHHMIHGLRFGPGGDIYFSQSIYINSFVETPWGVCRLNGSGVWRLRPDTMRLDVVCRGRVNPWGLAFDRWGASFSTDGAGGNGIGYVFDGAAYATHGLFDRQLEPLNPGRPKECGLEVLSGRHLPATWRGQMLTNDFRANRVVRYQLSERGSGYSSEFLGDVLASKHRSFRPVDVKVGPDGAIYVVDWYNPIIDHGEVDFHHPSRDTSHGRIWRVVAKDRPLVKPTNLAGASVAELLDALKAPEAWTRDQARRLLRERGAEVALPELRRWIATLDATHEDFEHQRTEALRVLQGLRVVDGELLSDVLTSPDHRARAAAVHVLADWQGRLPDAVELLGRAIEDEHPRVRLEAIGALRRLGTREAVELAMTAVERPMDEYLDFALWLTARELEPEWLPSLEAGDAIFDGDPAKVAFALAAVDKPAALAPMVELVRANKIDGRQRRAAWRLIAALGDAQQRALLIDEVEAQRESPEEVAILLGLIVRHVRSDQNAPRAAAKLLPLLDVPQAQLRMLTARLAGRWRIDDAFSRIGVMAGDETLQAAERIAAGEALLAINTDRALAQIRELTTGNRPLGVRASAAAAWSSVDVRSAAREAAEVLTTMDETDDPEPLFDALLRRRDGAEELTAALAGRSLSPRIATTAIRLAGETGRNLERLVHTLTRAGRLEPIPSMPETSELAELVRNVASQGDPHRGEAIYRRAELNCTACHAIGGAGPQVGPDLSSLGGSAQVVALFESLLKPSAKIKEGFETTTVVTTDGAVLSGRIDRQSSTDVVLRDAKDELANLRPEEIDEIEVSPLSLMPEGLTKSLRRDELVDLVRFLSALGREDDFRVTAQRRVRRFEILRPSANGTLSSEQEVAAAIVRDDANLRWETVYGTVAGGLPAAEIPLWRGPDQRATGWVRLVVDEEPRQSATTSAGAMAREAAFADVKGLTVWLNGRRQAISVEGVAALSPGRNVILVRVELEKRTSPLFVELR